MREFIVQLQSCRAGKSGAAAIFSVFRKTRILQMQQNPLFDQFVLQAGHILSLIHISEPTRPY